MHTNSEQLSFLMPFGGDFDQRNRWVRMARLMPWHVVEEAYGKSFRRERGGHRPLTARIALGSLIVKERLGLTDRETVEQIRENPYIQYFLGYGSFSSAAPFDASLMVHFRTRLGLECIQEMNAEVIAAMLRSESNQDQDGDNDDDDSAPPTGSSSSDTPPVPADGSAPTGSLLIDATCAPADITFPTDLKVLNHAREITERVIDVLHSPHAGTRPKPRTYRNRARRVFLSATKSKKMKQSDRRVAAGKQLRFLRRNLRTIAQEIAAGRWNLRLLDRVVYKKLLVASEVYRQQLHLYRTRDRSIPDRIVSVSQPHVRPIVRGKAGSPTEFGAKISVSLVGDYASLDRVSWDAFYEGADLPLQADSFRTRTGHYPAVIYADKAYTSRANRAWCSQRGIRLAGIGPGRPPADPTAERARRRTARDDQAARQPIEGVFGRGKRRWSLNRIMAKLACTSLCVIALVFLVMNLETLLTPILLALLVCSLALVVTRQLRIRLLHLDDAFSIAA
jgi:IS5 family transposase